MIGWARRMGCRGGRDRGRWRSGNVGLVVNVNVNLAAVAGAANVVIVVVVVVVVVIVYIVAVATIGTTADDGTGLFVNRSVYVCVSVFVVGPLEVER